MGDGAKGKNVESLKRKWGDHISDTLKKRKDDERE